MNRARILRDAAEVGQLDFATGQLTSEDATLNELWTRWQSKGFNVLWPPPERPPAGMLADAIRNVKPAPNNMGLVVLELENHGYTLQIDKPPRAGIKANPVFGRPADRSFAAYKVFIEEMTTALGAEKNASEDQLRQGWRRFWETDDSDAGAG